MNPSSSSAFASRTSSTSLDLSQFFQTFGHWPMAYPKDSILCNSKLCLSRLHLNEERFQRLPMNWIRLVSGLRNWTMFIEYHPVFVVELEHADAAQKHSKAFWSKNWILKVLLIGLEPFDWVALTEVAFWIKSLHNLCSKKILPHMAKT